MNGFLAILVSISLVGLVVGLATPEVFRKVFGTKTGRTSVGLSMGSLVVVFLVLFIVTAPKTTQQIDENTSSKITKATAPTTSTVQKPTINDQSEVTVSPPLQNSSSTVSSSSTSTAEIVEGPTGSSSNTVSVSGSGQISGVVSTPPVTHIINIGTYVDPILTPVQATCKSLNIDLQC
jgi:hypothetical protein